jgi:hypothetical protein
MVVADYFFAIKPDNCSDGNTCAKINPSGFQITPELNTETPSKVVHGRPITDKRLLAEIENINIKPLYTTIRVGNDTVEYNGTNLNYGRMTIPFEPVNSRSEQMNTVNGNTI